MGDLKPIASLHPDDQALLTPLDKIGKTQQKESSFLRRTEYVSSQNPHMYQSSTSKDLLRPKKEDLAKRAEAAKKDDYLNILRHQMKGFDIANPDTIYRGEDSLSNMRSAPASAEELDAWNNPKHPSDPKLQLVESYPLLPDLDALPSLESYMIIKINSNPINAPGYDERLDHAILRPLVTPEALALHKQKTEDWDPASGKPAPLPIFDYDYYLPDDPAAVDVLVRALNIKDPDGNDPEYYTEALEDGTKVIKFARKRTYETLNQIGDPNDHFNKQIAIALHDSNGQEGQPKGAYIYPISQRTAIRPKRNIGFSQQTQPEIEHIDEINVTVGEMSHSEQTMVKELKAKYLTDKKPTQAAAES